MLTLLFCGLLFQILARRLITQFFRDVLRLQAEDSADSAAAAAAAVANKLGADESVSDLVVTHSSSPSKPGFRRIPSIASSRPAKVARYRRNTYNSVVAVIRHFKTQVTTIQRAVRRFLRLRGGQIDALVRQWDAVYERQRRLFVEASRKYETETTSATVALCMRAVKMLMASFILLSLADSRSPILRHSRITSRRIRRDKRRYSSSKRCTKRWWQRKQRQRQRQRLQQQRGTQHFRSATLRPLERTCGDQANSPCTPLRLLHPSLTPLLTLPPSILRTRDRFHSRWMLHWLRRRAQRIPWMTAKRLLLPHLLSELHPCNPPLLEGERKQANRHGPKRRDSARNHRMRIGAEQALLQFLRRPLASLTRCCRISLPPRSWRPEFQPTRRSSSSTASSPTPRSVRSFMTTGRSGE